MKLDPKLSHYEQAWGWIGDPRCAGAGALEYLMIQNRYQLEIIGGAAEEPEYDYDEFAIVKWKRDYYLLQTNGCSYPSPSESWRVVAGPLTLRALRRKIATDSDYSLERLRGELLKIIRHGK